MCNWLWTRYIRVYVIPVEIKHGSALKSLTSYEIGILLSWPNTNNTTSVAGIHRRWFACCQAYHCLSGQNETSKEFLLPQTLLLSICIYNHHFNYRCRHSQARKMTKWKVTNLCSTWIRGSLRVSLRNRWMVRIIVFKVLNAYHECRDRYILLYI